MNICLILSGSIAAFKACELCSLLVKAGHEVQTVATEGALRFVGVASLEGLTDKKVYTELWAPRESKTHISLRKWSDLFVFYPATANRINELAAGLAPDLIGATFLANNFEKPFWIAPAMNTNMLRHPATRDALAKLEGWGCHIIRGDDGRLACGDVGEGRLAEPKAVFGLIERHFAEASGAAKGRVLVTGGAMTEAVDGVRAITNSSSGRTAAAIVRGFLDAGWSVDFLHHRSADLSGLDSWTASDRLRLRPYLGFTDFQSALEGHLTAAEYSVVVHASAVSDYRVGRVAGSGDGSGGSGQASLDKAREPADGSLVLARPDKLESGRPLSVELLPNPKLLPSIRRLATGRPLIIAFKLTVGADEAEGRRRADGFFAKDDADLVVWNDMAALGGDAGGDTGTAAIHPFVVFGRQGELARGLSNAELAAALVGATEAAGQAGSQP